MLINDYNTFGEHVLTGLPQPGDLYLDMSRDRMASVLDIAQVLDKRNGGAGKLTLQSPDRWLEYNRSMQAQTADWLRSQAASGRPSNPGR